VFRNQPRRVDEEIVVVLAWVCAVCLALCGSGLIVAGFYAGGGGLVLGVGLGVVVVGGSIPFVRAARRMNEARRDEPVTEAERRSRRRKVRAILGFYAACGLSAVLGPGWGTVRVIAVIAMVLVVPVALISEFDHVKRQ
jgi:multisubunit Na+/H+ antiporter MnhB subunit